MTSSSSPSSSPSAASVLAANQSQPRFSFIVAESYNAKKRPDNLNPATLLGKLGEARDKIAKEIRPSDTVVDEVIKSKGSKITPKEIQKLKSQHSRYVAALKQQAKEIEKEYKKVEAIVNMNLHKPLEFLRKSVNGNPKDTATKNDNTVTGYNPLSDLDIFDRSTGEDSFFISPTQGSISNRGIAFGVADGVGGWSTMGVDPSAVSKGLCYYMRQIFCAHMLNQLSSSSSTPTNSLPSPKALLNAAFTELQNIEHAAKKSGSLSAIAGGSTACVGIASASTGTLHTANLGDSGYAVYRGGKIAYHSNAQVHAFNTPYQLSIVPDLIKRLEAGDGSSNQKREEEGERIMDTPKDADTASLQLKHGDVIVFATDGFWDNVFLSASLDAVTKHMIAKGAWSQSGKDGIIPTTPILDPSKELGLNSIISPESAGNLAYKLVTAAYNAARNPKSSTPFAKEFMEEWKMQYDGGKPDDTTVLVAYVHDNQYLQNQAQIDELHKVKASL